MVITPARTAIPTATVGRLLVRLVAVAMLLAGAAVPAVAQEEQQPPRRRPAMQPVQQEGAQPGQQQRRPAQAQPAGRPQQGQQGQPGGRTATAAPARAGAAASSAPALGEYSMISNTTSRLLRLHAQGTADRQDRQVTVGEEFVTEISLRNSDLAGFDDVRVLLAYEPDYLQPLAINDSVLAPHLSAEPVSELDPLFGQILYEGRLSRPLTLNDSPLLSIRWRALKVTLETHIEFGQRDDLFTAVVGQGIDLLGHPDVPGDGTLNMAVTILPEDPREAEALLSDPRAFDPSTLKLGGVRLFLKPQDEPITVGEPFFVDVIYDNRAFSLLDTVSLMITYDSDIIDILDADHNNWITRGVNIHDGPFRSNFPWNYHIANEVNALRGTISYRVGTDNPEVGRGRVGTIARIYAVAQRPTAGTALRFRFAEHPRDRGTAVTYLGEDALGDPKVAADGAQGVVLRVQPKPRTSTQAATKQR